MKLFASFLVPLMLLSSCAPRAIVLGRPSASKPRPSSDLGSSTIASVPSESGTTSLPRPPGDDLGLLEPKGLTNLPDERDMQPTGGDPKIGPVIATPPKED